MGQPRKWHGHRPSCRTPPREPCAPTLAPAPRGRPRRCHAVGSPRPQNYLIGPIFACEITANALHTIPPHMGSTRRLCVGEARSDLHFARRADGSVAVTVRWVEGQLEVITA